MNVTELLVMGYDGDRPVFACHLTATAAATILPRTEADGDTAVEAVSCHASTAHASMVEVLKDIVGEGLVARSDDARCANGTAVVGGVGNLRQANGL